MMLPITVLMAALVFLPVEATKKCNLINFGESAGTQCGLKWLRNENIKDGKKFSPKISEIVKDTLGGFGIDSRQINNGIQRALRLPQSDPLSRLIELTLAVEPYLSYAVADAIVGFEMTPAELRKLHLPASLSSKSELKKLYHNYFDFSCEQNVLQSLASCLNDWMDDNCEKEDDTIFISKLLTNIMEFYCDGTSTEDDVFSRLDKDFGKVYVDVARRLGVVKDSSNPYVFGLTPNSFFLDHRRLSQLSQAAATNCEDELTNIREIAEGFLPESDTGAGATLRETLAVGKEFETCTREFYAQHVPEIFDADAIYMKHADWLSKRYTNGGYTVHAAFNLPIILAFLISKII